VDTEDFLFWKDLFDDMNERGLWDIKLTVYDGHKGIQKAVNESFHELGLQMCHIHLIRQVLKKVPKKKQRDVAEKLKEELIEP
jgi:transposase-like protein